MRLLLALGATVATLAMVASPLQAEEPRDGRYRVVAGVISSPADRAPHPQNRPVIILVDSWTGRSWQLNERMRWHPLAFDRPDPEQALYDILPPPLEMR